LTGFLTILPTGKFGAHLWHWIAGKWLPLR
jgi:hypothetical protein